MVSCHQHDKVALLLEARGSATFDLHRRNYLEMTPCEAKYLYYIIKVPLLALSVVDDIDLDAI